jgi:hypothetical protein
MRASGLACSAKYLPKGFKVKGTSLVPLKRTAGLYLPALHEQGCIILPKLQAPWI